MQVSFGAPTKVSDADIKTFDAMQIPLNALIVNSWNSLDLVSRTAAGFDVIHFTSLPLLEQYCADYDIRDVVTVPSWNVYYHMTDEHRAVDATYSTGLRTILFRETNSYVATDTIRDYTNFYMRPGTFGLVHQRAALRLASEHLLSAAEWEYLLAHNVVERYRINDLHGHVLHKPHVDLEDGLSRRGLLALGAVFLPSLYDGYWTSTPRHAVMVDDANGIGVCEVSSSALCGVRLADTLDDSNETR